MSFSTLNFDQGGRGSGLSVCPPVPVYTPRYGPRAAKRAKSAKLMCDYVEQATVLSHQELEEKRAQINHEPIQHQVLTSGGWGWKPLQGKEGIEPSSSCSDHTVKQQCLSVSPQPGVQAPGETEPVYVPRYGPRAARRAKLNSVKSCEGSTKPNQVISTEPATPLPKDEHLPADVLIRPRTRGKRQSTRNALVVGDSIVRHTETAFVGDDKRRRMRLCFPGATMQDLQRLAGSVLHGEGDEPVVVLHGGANDMGDKRLRGSSTALINRFRDMVGEYLSRGARVIVSGVLPIVEGGFRVGIRSNKGIRELNGKMREVCEEMGVDYIDNYSLFVGRKNLFTRDGLHLTEVGGDRLGVAMREAIEKVLNTA